MAQTRVRAFDWLRAAAILTMIQHHAEDLLRPELRGGLLYGAIDRVDGLVAPAFLMTAGFSLGLTQVRAGGDLARVRKTALRLGEVLLAATFVNWMWFPIFREPRWILRMDILQCIGVSLYLLLPLAALLARRPAMLAMASIAFGLLAFAAAPLAEAITGPAAAWLNLRRGALFPLLPWLGYVALGLATGAAAATSRSLLQRVLWAELGLGVCVRLMRPVWLALYPAHDFWRNDPSVHGDRWALVAALALALLWLEPRVKGKWGLVRLYSDHSLSAYVVHEALLYYSGLGIFSLMHWFGGRCGWPLYWLLTAVLIAATLPLCLLWDLATSALGRGLRRARSSGLAGGSSPRPA